MAKFGVRLGIVASCVAAAVLSAEEPTGSVPPIVEVEAVFRENKLDRRRAMPIEVRSEVEAASLFQGQALRGLLEQVDFDRQYAVVLAWSASGYDQVEAKDDPLDPRQVTLRVISSMRCDLADNVRVFAVRSDVRCRYLGCFDPPAPKSPRMDGELSIEGFGEARPEPHRVVYRIEEASVDAGSLPPGAYVELRDRGQASAYFSGRELKRIFNEVNFAEQYVLAFAWEGSRLDDVRAAIADANPRKVMFRLTPGQTSDVAQHVRVYALQAGATWTLKKQ